MKVLAVGDTHGHDTWKKIAESNEFDKFVFIGDYFDSRRSVSAPIQIANFKEIIEFKKKFPDKVVLLFGNHDFHYLRTTQETYSGYQWQHRVDIAEVLHDALDQNLLQMCYVHDEFLFSHAGVTKTWCANHEIDLNNLQQSINEEFQFRPNSFCFTMGENYDNYGDDTCQPPIWVRPRSLMRDKIDGYLQVVGHTTMQMLVPDLSIGFIMIDTLGTSGEYLIIEDKNITVGIVER